MSETPDPIDVEVGARIRIRRRLLSVSQEELANALKLTFQQVQKYEKGVNRVSASMLVRIAKRLDTTVAALVGEEDPVRRPTEVYQALAAPGGLELLRAYAAIPDGASKLALLKLVTALAYGERATDEAA
jgi:transcriptional regulator with XRE-family HTH domain